MATVKRFEDLDCWQEARKFVRAYAAFDQGYMDEKELEMIKEQADIVWKKVNNFIAYLNKSRKTYAKKAIMTGKNHG